MFLWVVVLNTFLLTFAWSVQLWPAYSSRGIGRLPPSLGPVLGNGKTWPASVLSLHTISGRHTAPIPRLSTPLNLSNFALPTCWFQPGGVWFAFSLKVLAAAMDSDGARQIFINNFPTLVMFYIPCHGRVYACYACSWEISPVVPSRTSRFENKENTLRTPVGPPEKPGVWQSVKGALREQRLG